MTEQRSGEISLEDLWQILSKQKKVIAYVWVSCVLLGLAYILVAKPMYKAEVFFLPPTLQDIQPLNISVPNSPSNSSNSSNTSGSSTVNDLESYKTGEVYDLFIQTLKSRSNRRDFYNKNGLESLLGFEGKGDAEVFFNTMFNEKLVVSRNVKKKELAGFVSISLEGPDAVLVAKWLNTYVEQTRAYVRGLLAQEVVSKVNSMKSNIKDMIASKLMLAQKRRADRVVELNEAIIIRQALGSQGKSGELTLRTDGLGLNTDKLPLYMLSEKMLRAEVKVLKSRKNDAPFVDGLRDLEEYVATLEQISVNRAHIEPVFVDQHAFVPNKPVKPNARLILLASIFAGLFLGILIVLLRDGVLFRKSAP